MASLREPFDGTLLYERCDGETAVGGIPFGRLVHGAQYADGDGEPVRS